MIRVSPRPQRPEKNPFAVGPRIQQLLADASRPQSAHLCCMIHGKAVDVPSASLLTNEPCLFDRRVSLSP